MPRPPSAVASEHARYAFFLFGVPTLFSVNLAQFNELSSEDEDCSTIERIGVIIENPRLKKAAQ